METRVAVLAIIVRDMASVPALNELLHQYAPYIIGRMGVPYHARGVNIISVAVDAPANDIPGDVPVPGRLRRGSGGRDARRGSCHRPGGGPEGPHRHGHGEADERYR